MSRMSDLYGEITELLSIGMVPQEVASRLNVSFSMVEAVMVTRDSNGDEYFDYRTADDFADADACYYGMR